MSIKRRNSGSVKRKEANSMNMNDLVFIVLGFITLLGAVGVVSFTNIVHAAQIGRASCRERV